MWICSKDKIVGFFEPHSMCSILSVYVEGNLKPCVSVPAGALTHQPFLRADLQSNSVRQIPSSLL